MTTRTDQYVLKARICGGKAPDLHNEIFLFSHNFSLTGNAISQLRFRNLVQHTFNTRLTEKQESPFQRK